VREDESNENCKVVINYGKYKKLQTTFATLFAETVNAIYCAM
jgi:hypothetical protein